MIAIEDDIYGDVFARGDCGSLKDLALPPEQSASCSFTASVSGVSGDIHTNTITATANDVQNDPVQGTASATVAITDLPPSLQVSKRANPTTVEEPGGQVTFDVLVVNASQFDVITLDSLVDDVHGDLLAQGLCPPPPKLFPGRDPYFCSFEAFVAGTEGFVENNTVTATARDEDDNVVEGSSQASVTVVGSTPTISATKTANPRIVENTDERIVFTFSITNTSRVDEVTIDAIEDSSFGDLNGKGDCSVPQVLQVGETYTCTYGVGLSGSDGDVHVNQFVATGSAEDGTPVGASDVAAVLFMGTREIPSLGRWGIGLMVLLLGYLGFARIRNGQ